MPGPEDDEAATPSHSDSAVEPCKTNNSSQSWHDWLVALFAGRKVSPATRSYQSKTTSSACSSVSDQLVPQPLKANSNLESNHAAPCRQPPQLLLSQVIPRIHAARVDRTFRRTAYRQILPAPVNPFTGYAVVAEDEFTPAIVIHGFDMPRSPSPKSMSRSQNNSAASLLDRDGDTWAMWNQRNTTASDMPFARTPSESESPVPQSKENTRLQRQDSFAQGDCWWKPSVALANKEAA